MAARARRDLLSRRSGRGAAGHHRGDPPADRPPPRAAAGKEGRTGRRASRLPARDLATTPATRA
ncbi:MAG: hypothetical protein MZV49_16080 [Rhodopseudomonas palustris]|nr:hypothetical protein [Rhodopseudomonas palustris]